jgi:hypothetical protein
MSPERWPFGGIQINALNSVLPAAVKGWGCRHRCVDGPAHAESLSAR